MVPRNTITITIIVYYLIKKNLHKDPTGSNYYVQRGPHTSNFFELTRANADVTSYCCIPTTKLPKKVREYHSTVVV